MKPSMKRIDGNIGPNDIEFYKRIINRIRPSLIVEIGVASGFSSIVALKAMEPWGGRLASYDIAKKCYYNPNLPVGFLVAEDYPQGLDRWELHTGKTSCEAGQEHKGVELAFIDGDHRHPFPTEDVERMIPAMAPGAWFVLHDISHGRVKRGCADGAVKLYDGWKGEKYRLEIGTDNIGAIRLPNNA